jgi:hypothetical protein
VGGEEDREGRDREERDRGDDPEAGAERGRAPSPLPTCVPGHPEGERRHHEQQQGPEVGAALHDRAEEEARPDRDGPAAFAEGSMTEQDEPREDGRGEVLSPAGEGLGDEEGAEAGGERAEGDR